MTDLGDSRIDLRAILGVLRRRARLILSVVFLVLAAAILVALLLKPVYTASALVLVDTTQKNLLDPGNPDPSGSTASARVDSEVELAKSPSVLMRVVREQNLTQNPLFTPQPGFLDRALGLVHLHQYVPPIGEDLVNQTYVKLQNAVSVQRRGLTFVIAIQAQAADPQQAALLANAVAETYINEQVKAKIDSVSKSRDIIQTQVTAAAKSVADSEGSIDSFIGTNIGAIAQETGRPDLAQLYQQIAQGQAAKSQLMATIDHASSALQKADWKSLALTLQTDDAVRQLEVQREQKEADLQAAASGSDFAVNLKSELDRVESQLNATAQQAISDLKNRVSDTQATVTSEDEKLRSDVLSSNLSSATLTKIYELQQNAKIAQDQYRTLLTRLNDFEAQTALQVADSRIFSEALAPSEPSFPNLKLVAIAATAFALAAGVALAFLYENVWGGITSIDQLQAAARSGRVLVVPRQREPKGRSAVADTMIYAPLSMFAESVRKLRLAADRSIQPVTTGGTPHGRVVLVTSAGSGEGKTTVALSLARAYAQSGQTTLLIDCDLRRPTVHRQLGWDSSAGLLDYLTRVDRPDAPSLRSLVRIEEASGTGVLVGSRRSDVATDVLVAGSRFEKVIEAAASTFDVVILDSPPLEPVVDSAYLARFADSIVFVVRWARTTLPEIRRGVESLTGAASTQPQLTFVLNVADRATERNHSSYGYYYNAG